MRQKVVTIEPRPAVPPVSPAAARKLVPANQQAIDALPLNSGTWRVQGVPGLYVRCRAASKSYLLQRRVRGVLVKRTLGPMPLKAARSEALKLWHQLRPAPASGKKTLEQALAEYLEQRPLAPKTRAIYRYNADRYLGAWKGRALEQIGQDRAGVRALYHQLVKRHGLATASQVIRMLSAVYRYARKVDPELPECPTVAVTLAPLKPRDWALSDAELRAWWDAVRQLSAIKRTWWLVCLLTGARRASVEALAWEDIDFHRKTIRFRVTKGDRPYVVPAADRLIAWLEDYRQNPEVPPSEWVFPSPRDPRRHLVNVRDEKRGVASAHHLRHTFRTVLAELGATPDQARLLMGHSLAGDVSRGYITAPLVVESLRPLANQMAERYARILGWDGDA
jgi:integrase